MENSTRKTSTVVDNFTSRPYEWLHRLINRRSYRISMLIIVCILNVIDLLVDWRFFMIKAIAQKVNEQQQQQ